MKKKIIAAGAAASSLMLIGTAVASATPASGDALPTNSTATISTLAGPSKAEKDGIELKVDSDTNVRRFIATYPPKSHSGWHAHPGIVMAIVRKGTVTRQLSDCSPPQKFTEGQVFTEVIGHKVSNETNEVAELEITHMYPSKVDLSKLRDDLAAPKC